MLYCIYRGVPRPSNQLLHNPLFAGGNRFPQLELLLVHVEDHVGPRVGVASLPSHRPDQLPGGQPGCDLGLGGVRLAGARGDRGLHRETDIGAAVRPVVAVLVDRRPVLPCWWRLNPPSEPVICSTVVTIVDSPLLTRIDLLSTPCSKLAITEGVVIWPSRGARVAKDLHWNQTVDSIGEVGIQVQIPGVKDLTKKVTSPPFSIAFHTHGMTSTATAIM